ncbi:patatin-like phospholipase family protein [Pseudomonas sp. MF6772]|jgi:NTE family protein|uniref:Patatin-like phospholipase family protein n=1 Tax=Pseudomonas shahriarae TaxID=2745512 RepID=A0ABT5NBN2_9PSED|nr:MULTISPECIES: patatin-like phospholipase family protein [Pseudomonas]MBJ2267519.1 patatin-like phospholipase family protein [Pseudomonas sp. MF6772]MBK3437692.1 patatin-like phospholipase family protein [Pseudomonas sp. MF7448]MBL7227201.1 patatin-like phospholipase family protein [Pseudomonas sp.]MCU0213581.1 patatin-like phospholipase family protein [Pseudomonas shahriarae]MDD0978149.1 patatin-like phospholipase family protein [Pseudomonas shahriarae]
MKKRVALVLGSGGARGYAHIGVIEEIEKRGYEIACIAGCSMGAVVGGIYAAGKLQDYRNWIESLDYLDVLRLVDVSFRLGAIRGEKVFGQIRKIVGEINIEDLRIPYTAVATDLTNQQEIWFQEGCLHQAMRASAAIPSLFTPVMQGNRMLVDGGLLNPLPIVPVVSSHCDLIIAVNLNATNQKHYTLPVIQRPPAFKSRFDNLVRSLGSHLPFRRKQAEQLLLLEQEALQAQAADINPWLEGAEPEAQQPAAAPETAGAPKSATGSFIIDNVGPASLLDLINQSFEVMQTSLAQYKIAGYPPDVLINVPKRVCRFFEFYKAPELIALGREIASDTLDRYESEQS